ncbi:hypothetical protein Dimus_035414, partial [Dionaea muscipula]
HLQPVFAHHHRYPCKEGEGRNTSSTTNRLLPASSITAEKEESTDHLCSHGSPPRREEIDVVMDPKRVRVFLVVFLILEQHFFTIE